MSNTKLISIQHICTVHEIEYTFITELKNYGLVELLIEEEQEYVVEEQLPTLEKMIRLHYDLNVNVEGLDVISNLLDKIENLQQTLRATENRLRLHEEW